MEIQISTNTESRGSVSSLFPIPRHIVSGEEEREVKEGIEYDVAVWTHERAPLVQHLLQQRVVRSFSVKLNNIHINVHNTLNVTILLVFARSRPCVAEAEK